ncbi:MAG: NUDIX hydrolase [Candidatus Nanoarchaeia archaeon]
MEHFKKIQVIIYRKNSQESLEILALKRTPEKKGEWQPVTGNVEQNETFEQAAKREVEEEIGISETLQCIDLEFEFEYSKNEKQFQEKVFAIEVDYNKRISLEQNPSKEHIDSIWISYDGAFEMFNYPEQKEALNRLYKLFYN